MRVMVYCAVLCRAVCVYNFLGVLQRVNTADVFFLLLLRRLTPQRRDHFLVAIATHFTHRFFFWYSLPFHTMSVQMVISGIFCWLLSSLSYWCVSMNVCVRACEHSIDVLQCVHCAHIQTQFDAIACYFNTNRDASIKTYPTNWSINRNHMKIFQNSLNFSLFFHLNLHSARNEKVYS